MSEYTIYHNPRCSKSRQALALLESHQIKPHIIEYIKSPLSYEQLKELSSHFTLKDFVRTNEPAFKALGLSLENTEEVLHAMVSEPKLMQRPIVVHEAKAIIGRPPEKVLELI